ncbi:MAG: copper amine oxidase domain protein, partial [Armatimonadetes bacterium]|nr:copper amine oxidase domain protein [Armatimonadota bacterium]
MDTIRVSPWLVAGALGTTLALPAAAEIQVEVNSKPVQFGAVQPARVAGRVLIPLRAVVESLGAEVKWEAATQTVRGRRGERTFELRINSREGQMNGMPITLEVPAQMLSGTTMVPLRFVGEALGAEVEWNAARQLVVITAKEEGAPEVADSRVEGELVAVRDNEVTVRVGNVRQTYALGADTIILRGAVGARGQSAEPSELKRGDKVRLRVNPNTGAAEVVEATFAAVAEVPERGPANLLDGEVVEVRERQGQRTITVQAGDRRETVELDEQSPIFRSKDRQPASRVELDDLRIGDRVKVSRSRRGQVTRVDATAEVRRADQGDVVGELVTVRRTGIVVRSGMDRAGYDVDRDTMIYRSRDKTRGARATLDELEPGDQVTVRLDATGNIAKVIEARGTEAAPAPAADLKVTSFTHDAPELLKAGDEIHVTLVGTPKASAS